MSVSQKSLRLFCILPSEIASTQQNIIPSSCTNIIDITHSERIPIPPQSWVRTRVRRGVPGKGPVILSGGNHKNPIRGRETWLEVTNTQRISAKFAGLVLRGREVGGLVSTECIWNLLPKIPEKTRVIVDANLLPHEIAQLKKGMENGEIKAQIEGIILSDLLLGFESTQLPSQISSHIENRDIVSQRLDIDKKSGYQFFAHLASNAVKRLSKGERFWSIAQNWFHEGGSKKGIIPLGQRASLLQEIHAKYSSLHSWIDVYQKSIAGEDIFTDQKDGKEDRTQKQKVEQKEAKKEQPTQRITSDQTDQTTFSNQDTESNQKKGTKILSKATKQQEDSTSPNSSTQKIEYRIELQDIIHEPIAIIGLGCRFPDADNIESFWNNIINKHASFTEVPHQRWRPDLFWSENKKDPAKTYCKIGAFLKDFSFPSKKFRIPPKVAEKIDPVQQIALCGVADALEDSGYHQDQEKGKAVDRSRVAVILGNSMGGELTDDYTILTRYPELEEQIIQSAQDIGLDKAQTQSLQHAIQNNIRDVLPAVTEDSMPGELANVIAGRIANAFDFNGPNFTLDAACASTMAAIQSAVQGLRNNDFDMAVTGGVDRSMGVPTYVKFSKIGALSPTHSAPFDESANGFVMGEGCGILILKRLSDALRDEDKIYATIRSIGSSSDGRGKGITAPNPKGQLLAVQRAYQDIQPQSVDIVECHGTSTIVGDRVELETLSKVMQDRDTPLRVGSVKSNIGHLKAAAGSASLIKMALAIHKKQYPPSANFEKMKEGIEVQNILVQTETEPWKKTTIRRAGVSAFGFGGTNFHVVLEEPVTKIQTVRTLQPSKPPIATKESPTLYRTFLENLYCSFFDNYDAFSTKITSSKASETLLPVAQDIQIAPISLFMTKDGFDNQYERLQKTLQSKRSPSMLRGRGIFIENNLDEDTKHIANGKIAFVFTGQGSQYLDMGKELAEKFPIVQQTFDEADNLMKQYSNLDRPLSEYMFRQEDILEKDQFLMLQDTRIAQPATLTIDVALLRLLDSFGITPDMVAGHSLGEYSAAVAAGVLSFKDAMIAVSARGREMASIEIEDPGQMIGVGASPERVEAILSEVRESLLQREEELHYVVAANKNSPAQTVIAGSSKGVDQVLEYLEHQKISFQRLPVSHAFHTKIVAPASKPLEGILEKLDIKLPQIPISSNVTGTWYPDSKEEIIGLLSQQIASPVEWTKQMELLYASGARTFVECGPKRALTGFLTAMFRNKPHRAFASNHPKQGQSTSFLHCLASIYALQPEKLQQFLSNSTEEKPHVSQASLEDQTQHLETIQNKNVIVCSGASVGLPGGKELFSDLNISNLLSGFNGISQLSQEEKARFVQKKIVRLNKDAQTGIGHFSVVHSTSDVIQLAGKKGHFNITDFGVSPELKDALDITTQMAFAAGLLALKDAGIPLVAKYKTTTTGKKALDGWALPKKMRERTGVIFASAFPGYSNLIKHLKKEDPSSSFDRRFLFQILSMGHSQFAQFIMAQGPNTQVNAACASTTQAISIAQDWIDNNRADRVVVIGADDVTNDELLEWIGSGFLAAGAATTQDDVKEAALPFDERRHGMILGMGAVGMVLEKEQVALERGHKPIAILRGSHIGNSAFHGSRLLPKHIATCMKTFMQDISKEQDIPLQEIAQSSIFVSHETYTPAKGGSAAAEIDSLRQTFGDDARHIVITNTKGFTGHSMGAGIEDILAVKALEHGQIPPIPNLKKPDPALGDLLLSSGGRFEGSYAIRLAAGFGSQLALLLWEKYPQIPMSKEQRTDEFYQQKKSTWLHSLLHENEQVEDMQLFVEHHTLKWGQPKPQPSSKPEQNTKAGTNTKEDPNTISPSLNPEDSTLNQKEVTEQGSEEVFVEQNITTDTQEDSRNVAVQTTPMSKRSYTKDEIEVHVLTLLCDMTGYDKEDLELDFDLEGDLGIDTVKQAELFADLKEWANIDESKNSTELRNIELLINWIFEHQELKIETQITEKTPPLSQEISDTTPIKVEEPSTISQQTPSAKNEENEKKNEIESPIPDSNKKTMVAIEANSPQVYTKDEIEVHVLTLLCDMTGYDKEDLELDFDLEGDLGIDTVKQAELFADLKEWANIDESKNSTELRNIELLINWIFEHQEPKLKTQLDTNADRSETMNDTSLFEQKKDLETQEGVPFEAELQDKTQIEKITEVEKTVEEKHVEEKVEDEREEEHSKKQTITQGKHLFNDSVLKEETSEEESSEETFSTNLTDITSTENEDNSPKVSEDINNSKKEAKDQILISEENNALKSLFQQLSTTKTSISSRKRKRIKKRSTPSVKAEIQEVSQIEESPKVTNIKIRRTMLVENHAFFENRSLSQTPLTFHILGSSQLSRRLHACLVEHGWKPQVSNPEVILDMQMMPLSSFSFAQKINTPKMWFTIIQNSDQQDLEQHAQSGGIAGFTKALGREWTSCKMSILILQDMSIDKKVESVCFELQQNESLWEIFRTDSKRYSVVYEEVPSPKRGQFKGSKTPTILLTGGSRGITAEIAKSFARRGRCNLILFSRTQPNNHPLNEKLSKEQIRQELTFAGEKITPAKIEKKLNQLRKADEARQNIEFLKKLGAQVLFCSTDIQDGASVKRSLERAQSVFGNIDIVVHGAGAEKSRLFEQKTIAEFHSIFEPKVQGAIHLLRLLPKAYFVGMGSIAGRFGNAGQIDYSAANDALSHVLSRRGNALHISWSAWGDTGMAVRAGMDRVLRDKGIEFLPAVQTSELLVDLILEKEMGELVISRSLGNLRIPQGHPFVDDLLFLSNSQIVHKSLSLRNDVWLSDHSIGGTAVLPGVIGLEIMIEGARTCHGNSSVYAVKNLHFTKPIKVYPQRPVDVEVHMSSEEGLLVDCELQSIRTLAKDRIFRSSDFSCVVSFDENEQVDILPVVESGLVENTNVTQSDIYRYFFHGPRFQVLDKIEHLSPHHLHGYISVNTFMRSTTDPLVLEAVFQAAGFHHMVFEQENVLPASVTDIYYYTNRIMSEDRVEIFVQSQQKTQNHGDVLYDIDVLQGEDLIMSVRGLSFAVKSKMSDTLSSDEMQKLLSFARGDVHVNSTFDISNSDLFHQFQKGTKTKRQKDQMRCDELLRRSIDIPSDALSIQRHPNGMPFVSLKGSSENPLPISVSMSHGHGHGIVAWHRYHTVGVDLEKIEERSESFEIHWFSARERLLIQNLLVKAKNPHHTRSFFQTCFWSIKEAVCKALTIGGMGGEGMRSIEIEDFSEHQAKVRFTGIAQDVFQKINAPIHIQHWTHTEHLLVVSYVQLYTHKAWNVPILENSLVESA